MREIGDVAMFKSEEEVGRDRAAIEAALTYDWSSGQVEGQVTRLKLVKRQMFGRAKVDLLRKRFLLAG